MGCLKKLNNIGFGFIVLTIVLSMFASLGIGSLKAYVLSGAMVVAIAIMYSGLETPKQFYCLVKLNIPLFLLMVLIITKGVFYLNDKESLVAVVKFCFLYVFFIALCAMCLNGKLNIEKLSLMCGIANIILCFVVIYKMHGWGWQNISLMNLSGNVQSGNSIYSTYIYETFYSFPFLNSQNYVASFILTLMGLNALVLDNLGGKKYVVNVLSLVIGAVVIFLSLSKTAILGAGILFLFLLFSRLKMALCIGLVFVLAAIINPLSIREGVLNRFDVFGSIENSVVAEQSKVGSNPDNKIEIEKNTALKLNLEDSTVLDTPPPLEEKKLDKTKNSMGDISVSSRIQLWETAIRLIKKHPFIGNGLRTTRSEFANAVPSDPHVNHPHNLYLQAFVDVGGIGFVLLIASFIIFIKYVVLSIVKNEGSKFINISLLGILVFHLFRGFFGFQLEEMDTWLLFSVIIIVAIKNTNQEGSIYAK